MNATEQKHIEIVRQLYEVVLNQNRKDLLPELLTEDIVFHGFTEERGRNGYQAVTERIRTSFPDLHFTLNDLIASHDRVVVRWTMHATHNGPLGNVPPSGKPVQQHAIVIYRFENGKIAEGWAQMDRLGVLQQIGAAPGTGQTNQPAKETAAK